MQVVLSCERCDVYVGRNNRMTFKHFSFVRRKQCEYDRKTAQDKICMSYREY